MIGTLALFMRWFSGIFRAIMNELKLVLLLCPGKCLDTVTHLCLLVTDRVLECWIAQRCYVRPRLRLYRAGNIRLFTQIIFNAETSQLLSVVLEQTSDGEDGIQGLTEVFPISS